MQNYGRIPGRAQAPDIAASILSAADPHFFSKYLKKNLAVRGPCLYIDILPKQGSLYFAVFFGERFLLHPRIPPISQLNVFLVDETQWWVYIGGLWFLAL